MHEQLFEGYKDWHIPGPETPKTEPNMASLSTSWIFFKSIVN